MGQFSFAKVAVNHATVAVDFGDDNILQVEYSPDRLTSRFAMEMATLGSAANTANADDADKMQANITAAVDSLLRLVTGWNAFEEDAATGEMQPMPLDRDHLLDLPISQLNRIFTAVMQDQAGEVLAPTGSGKVQP